MAFKILTNQQVEQFIERGWVMVEEAFPHETALAAQEVLWRKLEERGVLKNDRTTWTQQMVRMNETYSTPEFQRCNTKRMAKAIEDLIGDGRWANRSVYGETEYQAGYGWWPVNFALEADRPWDVPVGGWHWDGIHFRHHIDSPEQGLLCLCLFSEIGPQGGGTVVAEGSHKVVAKFLAQHPDGIELGEGIRRANHSHPWLAELTGSTRRNENHHEENDINAGGEEESAAASRVNRIEKFMNEYIDSEGVRLRVVETTGSPGDVILCHPFLYHAPTQNLSGVPRFMCNRTTPLKERMSLRRANPTEYSPLEISIRRALSYE